MLLKYRDNLLPLVEVAYFSLYAVLSQAYSSDCGKWWTKEINKNGVLVNPNPTVATHGETYIGKSGDCREEQMSVGLLRPQGEIA